MRTTIRFHGDLRRLARPAGGGDVQVEVREPRSVKDLIESVGVPHTEVVHVTVDDLPAAFDHLVAGGEVVAVHPPTAAPADGGSVAPPPAPDRFVCDVHLGTLTRRLRLLGFDTWYRNDADDATLAAVAVADDRVLLSRDRQLLSRRVIAHGHLPRSDDPDTQVAEVVERFGLAARAAPLTRCVPCNGPLDPVVVDEVAAQIPPRSRVAFGRFARCRTCGQVFWPGSHLDAMADVLALTDPRTAVSETR